MPSAAGFPSLPRRGQGRFFSRTNLSLTLSFERRGNLTVTVRYLVGVKTGRFANWDTTDSPDGTWRIDYEPAAVA